MHNTYFSFNIFTSYDRIVVNTGHCKYGEGQKELNNPSINYTTKLVEVRIYIKNNSLHHIGDNAPS